MPGKDADRAPRRRSESHPSTARKHQPDVPARHTLRSPARVCNELVRPVLPTLKYVRRAPDNWEQQLLSLGPSIRSRHSVRILMRRILPGALERVNKELWVLFSLF